MSDNVVAISKDLAEASVFFSGPLGGRSTLEPIDAVAIDVTDPVELAGIESALDEHLVEDVLESFFSRLKNCLELREKAHAIQASEVQNAATLKALKSKGGPAHEIEALETIARLGDVDGHGLNFRQRFAYLRALFDENLRQTAARAKVAARGLGRVYGINKPDLPKPSATGYLDALTVWGQQVSDLLHQELQSRRLHRMSFFLGSADAANSSSQIFSLTDWPAKLAAKDFTFKLPKDYLEERSGPGALIREVCIEAVAKDFGARLWPARISVTNGDQIKKAPVMIAPGSIELAGRFALNAQLHNVDPLGEWHLVVEPKPIDGSGLALENLILHLTVSARLA